MKKTQSPILLAALALWSGLGADAWAAAEGLTLSLRESAEWNSNPLMQTGGHGDEIYGSVTEGSAVYRQKKERSLLDASIRASQNLYNDADYNSTDFHAKLLGETKGLRSDVGLGAFAVLDSTRNGEKVDVFSTDKVVRRKGFGVSPSGGYALNELNKLILQLDYAQFDFDDASHTDYRQMKATPVWEHQISPRWFSTLSVENRRYEALSGDKKTVDGISPMFGLRVHPSEEWECFFRIGQEASRDKLSNGTETGWEWNAVYAAGLSQKTQNTLWRMEATRAQESFSDGQNYLVTGVSFQGERDLSPQWGVRGGADYQYADSGNEPSGQMKQWVSANVGVNYKWTDAVALETSYRHKFEEQTGDGKTAQQQIVKMGIVIQRPFGL